MQGYFSRRLLLFVPTLLLSSMLIFVAMRVLPGDVAVLILAGPEGDSPFTAEDVVRVRQQLGLDDPLLVQYWHWLVGVVRLDPANSYFSSSPVSTEIVRRFLRVTLELTLVSSVLATLIGIPAGVLAAVTQGSRWDRIVRVYAFAGLSLPAFWTGWLMLWFTVGVLNWIPPLGFVPIWVDPWKNVQQVVLPSLALAYILSSSIVRMTRSTMLEVLREDYVRTGWAKGLGPRTVLMRHALPNALIPIVTLIGLQFGSLLGGTAIVETMFSLPGIGSSAVLAVRRQDYPLVQFIVMFFVLTFMAVNLVLDLLYGVLDPRIRYN